MGIKFVSISPYYAKALVRGVVVSPSNAVTLYVDKCSVCVCVCPFFLLSFYNFNFLCECVRAIIWFVDVILSLLVNELFPKIGQIVVRCSLSLRDVLFQRHHSRSLLACIFHTLRRWCVFTSWWHIRAFAILLLCISYSARMCQYASCNEITYVRFYSQHCHRQCITQYDYWLRGSYITLLVKADATTAGCVTATARSMGKQKS